MPAPSRHVASHGWRRRRRRLSTLPRTVVAATLLAAPLAAIFAPAVSLIPWPLSIGSPRINLSASLPRGLYLLEPLRRAPREGDLVLACPPFAAANLARRRGYLDPGPCPGGSRPLGKLTLAAAGDLVELTASGVAINRCRLPSSAFQTADTRGRPLPHRPFGAYRVGAGEIWLFSPHPRSFDSRYFGPIAITEIRGILHPFVVVHRAPLLRWASLLRACGSQP